MLLLLKCCFTSTEAVSLLGTGTQNVHLDFHTAPELWSREMFSTLLTYITEQEIPKKWCRQAFRILWLLHSLKQSSREAWNNWVPHKLKEATRQTCRRSCIRAQDVKLCDKSVSWCKPVYWSIKTQDIRRRIIIIYIFSIALIPRWASSTR